MAYCDQSDVLQLNTDKESILEKRRQSRREFLYAMRAISAGSLLSPFFSLANAVEPTGSKDAQSVVPTRPFGNTGVDVPILAFGGSLDINRLVLRQAVKRGVTYWDTAASYAGGNSEKRMGEYIGKYPEDRKKIFLVTKSHAWRFKSMTKDLDRSLQRMQTDSIDLFLRHSVRSPNDLEEDLKVWAEKAKSEGKIRFFGFSTHSNMEACMLEASKQGWIDAIMMKYDYRLMATDRMKRAVDACAKAGIGLTAMKTQGGGSVKTNTESELKLAGRFLEKGFTDAQAKLIAVWENPSIATICSEMPNMTILMSNVTAAMNKSRLSTRDLKVLHQYAEETRSDYCAGCSDNCESIVNGEVPVSDIMRYLMYDRSYGNFDRAKSLFNQLPLDTRKKIACTDFTQAERRCPQRMAIGRLMEEAVSVFS
jgi:predicted aldo/keto reductase-like oxidoreductase